MGKKWGNERIIIGKPIVMSHNHVAVQISPGFSLWGNLTPPPPPILIVVQLYISVTESDTFYLWKFLLVSKNLVVQFKVAVSRDFSPFFYSMNPTHLDP